MTKFQKRVKEIVAKVYPVQTVCKRNGTVETKKGYFFPHNLTAKMWGENVKKALETAGLEVIIDTWYAPAVFPRMSYIVAAVKELTNAKNKTSKES